MWRLTPAPILWCLRCNQKRATGWADRLCPSCAADITAELEQDITRLQEETS